MLQHKSMLSQRRLWLLMAGAFLICVVGLGTMWFRPLGDTHTYLYNMAFANSRTPLQWSGTAPDLKVVEARSAPATSDPNEVGVLPLAAVTVDIWFLSQPETFDAEHIYASRLERGRIGDGPLTYYLEFTEEGLNQYLHYWFGDGSAVDPRLRNVWFDLKPGSLIVYAEVDVLGNWQRIGAVFNLAANGRQFTFIGLDSAGQLYGAPAAGPIAEVISSLEAQGNRALRELKFIDPAGNLYLQQIAIMEDGAQILARCESTDH
ncbi:hypothetical protein TFLX_00909 [Thermoflexales bacterium]|nr:hypothetical protein TFLX_00909 [Thermoflexales bacterium]